MLERKSDRLWEMLMDGLVPTVALLLSTPHDMSTTVDRTCIVSSGITFQFTICSQESSPYLK